MAAVFRRDVLYTCRQTFALAATPYEHRILAHPFVTVGWNRGREPYVTGPGLTARSIVVAPGTALYALRFRPGHARNALGIPPQHLVGGRVPLGDLWGRAGTDLADRMDGEASDEAAWAVLVGALAQRAATWEAPDPLVDAAVASLSQSRHADVALLGGSVGISERQLRRRFTGAVGLSPTSFHRIVRLRRFLALTRDRATADRPLRSLAMEVGYADQAHLTREFTTLAGLSPLAHLTDSRSWA